jgi:hypothetical protein
MRVLAKRRRSAFGFAQLQAAFSTRSPASTRPLLRQAAEDVRAADVCWAVLRGHHDDPPGSAHALRFLGAVHRIVLQGQAPQLAACYPSAGRDSDCNDPWPHFHAVVQQRAAVLRELVHHPVQTNEVGRCAALLGGFVEVARHNGLPLRLLEVGGCSRSRADASL